jgi:acyl-CoA synthetase (AMP-forming)/AMP-acid ligase II
LFKKALEVRGKPRIFGPLRDPFSWVFMCLTLRFGIPLLFPLGSEGFYDKVIDECYHNGYFTVGDMARVDEEGYYYIVDRVVDMIISGGVNIYPAEIEEVLYNNPDVYNVAIIGVPDPEWGEERIVAYVIPQKNAKISEQDIIDYVARTLASYKKPRKVIFVEELPYTP